MAFIPRGARWYLADLVLEHRIEGEERNVVYVNMHLIEAQSPERAYEKAVALGRSSEQEYENTDGKQVTVTFRGLRQLSVIHEELEDGSELTYSETVGVSESTLLEWVRPRAALNVFGPTEHEAVTPNYMPELVARMLEAKGVSRGDLNGGA